MSEKRSKLSSWWIPGVIVALAIALVTFVVVYEFGDDTSAPSSAAADTAAGPNDSRYDMGLERRDPHDPLALGRVDAPVTLIVFTDYQCPFCAKWSRDTLPTLLTRVDSGDLRIEMRDVNVFGEASRRAAKASYAAALQGRFIDYHQALFADGKPRTGAGLSTEALTDIARRLGLDIPRFDEQMSSATTDAAIRQNEQVGAVAGAYSTPSFILGGQPIAGAQPTAVFVGMLDELTGPKGN
ncbi:thioredoxin domain-containing protein [Gordonia sp. VNK1]|uniref:DsbA family protein n=1 Tax=Gordonia oleivorans TaxID=3156618 RepID=UPI0032B62000